jgi:hypothetical protein
MLRKKAIMYNLYLNAYINNAEKYKQGILSQKQYIYKLIFNTVKAVNSMPKDEYMTMEEAQHYFEFCSTGIDAIGLITPREFLNIFPLDKEYDGNKLECKDYFYSINYIKEYGMDKLINNGMDFLWEYYNRETRLFLVNTLSIISYIRRFQGYSSIAEQWAEDNNIKTMRKYTDNIGKEFLLDNNGKTTKIKKTHPKYLKLIK